MEQLQTFFFRGKRNYGSGRLIFLLLNVCALIWKKENFIAWWSRTFLFFYWKWRRKSESSRPPSTGKNIKEEKGRKIIQAFLSLSYMAGNDPLCHNPLNWNGTITYFLWCEIFSIVILNVHLSLKIWILFSSFPTKRFYLYFWWNKKRGILKCSLDNKAHDERLFRLRLQKLFRKKKQGEATSVNGTVVKYTPKIVEILQQTGILERNYL